MSFKLNSIDYPPTNNSTRIIAKENEVFSPWIVAGATTNGHYRCDLPLNTLNRTLYDGLRKFLSLYLKKTGQFGHRCRRVGTPLQSTLQFFPDILDRVMGRVLRGSVQSLDPFLPYQAMVVLATWQVASSS